ncbi:MULTISPECIES: GntR family transcriptional regulator [Alteribacter]|uniref:GntR family transcriptional regulator n=1 Tax=Alteribacter keqinensis TaxID=2483800 RepID=A0A3M7TV57_9BACI|nr:MULTISPECIES: GntR family transcriptional regulator [Alteribacter]MBM7094236.1 GntR family transcriptional regulator [Alteribacter salitolerans]RNA69530.1 GntR family transcriptional regulator [Alteribacter keqinensis]
MIKSDHRPLYLQVIDRIKDDIDKGHYEPGERLPSEFGLSKQLGVSRATLREALRMLEDESVIIRRHGVGTFVNSKPLFTSGIEELNSVTDMIKTSNMEPGTIFLSSTVQPASEDDCVRFNDLNLKEIIVIERVRTADGKPVVYCLDKLPKRLLPDYVSHKEESIFNQLESSGTSISYAHTQIEPVGFHEKVSEILECEPETSLLTLKQMHFNLQETPVLYSINYFRADKFKFHVIRKRV